MLGAIQRAGVTIGSHTRSHVFMTNETRERVVEEVRESRNEIERRLGTEVRHFAYPSGFFNSSVVNAVAAAGYQYGYTTCAHQDPEHPLLTVPRTVLWENSCLDPHGLFSGAVMSCQVHRAFALVNRCRQRHLVTQEVGNGYL